MWHSMEELREADMDYSGYGKTLDILGIKEESGRILFRHVERNGKRHPGKFSTRFGRFVSEDHGEFGGILWFPGGGSMSGNFCDVFDFGDRVYAVDSLRHMAGHFRLLEFTSPSEYKETYHTKDVFDGSWDFTESLHMDASVKTEDTVWFLLGGETILHRGEDEKDEIKPCARLLKLTADGLEEVVSCGERFSYVEDMVIMDDAAYVSMDKMVARLDIETGSRRYWTSLSREECGKYTGRR